MSSFARASTPATLNEHMQMPQPTRLGAWPSRSRKHYLNKPVFALLLVTRSEVTRHTRLEHYCVMCRC